MHLNRRDIFKKRKSKVYKNLVSYGQYGVITGITMLTLGAGTVVSAAETSSSSADTASSALSSTTATTETTTDSSAVSKITVNMEPLIVEGVSFDVSAIPEASTLIANATELQASGATISYTTSPVAGDTVANIRVTYADGNSQAVAVPVTVTDQSAVQAATETTTSNTVEVAAETTDTASSSTTDTSTAATDTATSAGVATATTETATPASDVAATTASESSVTSETPLLDGALATTNPTAEPVESATFSWQEVPAASTLIANSSELVAADASIAYVSQPTFGMTSASILVTYTDGTSVVVSVPITVTANAVRKTLAAAVEEGSGTRAVATSPNTSGTVSGSLTSQSATSNLKVIDTVNQTTVLDISGDAANYSGGYLEVRITNGSSLDVTPSPLTGVTATKSYDGNDAVIKYTFGPSGLNGGAYYSLKFSYKFKAVDNWGNVVDDLNDNDFNIVTTSNFYDQDGLLVKNLGSTTHNFMEAYNAANIGTRMSDKQVVGYDLNKDGLVDAGAGQLNFFVHTGVLREDGTSVSNDFFSPGTGVFDGRMVNGLGPGGVGGAAIDAVTSYTYDVSLVPGTTLSAESIAAGWYEDATGYHLSADRANNPIPGDSTSNLNNNTYNFVPLILDIVDGTSAATIMNNRSISVTGNYTKEDGTTYSNTRAVNYNVIIPTAEITDGDIYLTHSIHGNGDSEILKSYGRGYYYTNVGLASHVATDVPVDMTDYSIRITTNNDNEFFNYVSIGSVPTTKDIEEGGSIQVYDDATDNLLHTFDKTNVSKDFTIDEALKVKTLRYEFINMELEKDSTNTQNTSVYSMRENTFFSDWSTIYKDSSITSLTSSTTATLQNDEGTVDTSQTRSTVLERIVYNVFMKDSPTNYTWNLRTTGSGFVQAYSVTNTKTNKANDFNEMQTAAYPGELYQAYLVDPELKLGSNPNLQVIYNWNNTGKDLYYETLPVTGTTDPINQNVVQMANNFVPNGTYEVLTIGFWAEVDPGFKPTAGIDLTAPINGINITTENSTTRTFTVTLNASEASGVLSQVKPDSSTGFGFNTNNNEAQNIVDFKVKYKNVSPQELSDVTVITSLPRTGDKQLDAATKNRNSQFSVYLTEAVTPPAGWEAVYTTVAGTSVQMEAGTWLTADQVTDWSTITAVKFVATGPVAPSSAVDFYIDNAVIGGDALQGEKAYLSSASSVGTAAYIESNNVLIEMAREIADGTVTVKYVNEAGEVIATEKVLKNDIKSDYDASNQETYYPTNITGTDGLPYVYVKKDPNSAPNTGAYSETPQVITHVYKLVPQTATFTYKDVTDAANPVQLGAVDSETGGSGQDITYDTTTRINEYLKQGYELVDNNYTDTTKYDTDATVDQPFTIKLSQRVVDIPEDAVPGKPVDPTDPNSPLWPDTVGTLVTELVQSRAIEYRYLSVTGDEAAAPVVQTVTFTRTATVNLVTGEIVYGEWTSEDPIYEEVVSPTIPGYTANIPVVSEVTGEPGVEIGIARIVYTPNEQVATVTYTDETTGKTLEVEDLTGVTDAPIGYTTADRIAYYESLGYELVSDNYPAGAVYDNIDGNSQDYKVVLKHIIEPATPDTVDPKTKAPVELSRTVTRTIEYKYIDENGAEASATVTQTATFTRTATVDKVTGEVVYADWTSADAELDTVDSPVIAGYTANVLNVPALTVDADSTNSNVLVIYTPNEQVATVTYIDETTGQVLEVADLTGVTDAAIGYTTADRIAYYESLGYELVSDNYPTDAVYDNIDGNSQDYKVVLKHIIEPVTPDDPTNPKDGSTLELTRTVTRTIEYKYIDENGAEASATVTQTATFTRTATVDMVTGEVVYADWTSADAELDRVNSPAIQGYTPNMANVPALTVNADTEDQSVVVIYTPDVQKASVTYIDETTGATLEITNLTGETDAAIGYTTADRIAYYESIGYELVSDNYPNGEVYDKDGNVTQEFQVVLKHIETPVTPDDPTNPKDGSTLELTRTVTRTIEYKYFTEKGEEASATVIQTVTFTRTATVDMVTGQVTYAAWETDSADLAQVDSPVIDGYTPNLSSIPAMTVDPNQSDIHTVVIYNADQQKARVTYYDQTSGRVLETSDLTGLSDEAIDYTTTDRIAYYESIGYRLVSNDYPDAPVYDKDGNVLQEYQVVLEHIINPVTPDNPINPKTGQELNLTKTVTRTIEYKYLTEAGTEASATVTQTATFTRTATVDMVTGKVVYTDWTSENPILDAVTSPEIPGYTASQLVVDSVQVTPNQSSLNTIVVYTPDVQKASVDFIDETSGTTLHTENLSGVTDQTIGYSTEEKIAYYESIGYELVTDGYPTDSIYDKDGNVDQNFTVTLRQKQVPVDPTNPTNPKDGSTLELTRTVTRTIEYKYIDENGQEASATVTQTATFTRTAIVNMVTGEVTYGEWTSEDAELDAVDSPAIQGYTPNLANVPALTVDADTENQTVVIIYTPDTQKATITYIDETTGETITVDEVTGDTDSPIGYTTEDRIKALEEQGYELVTDGYPADSVYDKDGNVDQNFTVTLRQKQVPVDPTDPTNPKDGSTLELTQTVTRTIEYKYIDENGQEASATVTQTATFTRTATVNMVTGEVTYGEWTSEDAELDAVDSPVIDGYTPNMANVPALTVDAATEDQSVVVIYTPDTQKATISYVDETTGETITVDEVTGNTDSPIGYTTEDRIKALEEQGYELVSDGYPTDSVYDKDGNVDQNFTVTLRQKQVPVDPTDPTNPKDGSQLELTQTVTRTIEYKYIDENGQEASATVTQTATFTRTATVNMVTGEVTYGDWTSEDAELDAVVSPAIDGYTPNMANVPALTVDADTENQTVVVIYNPDTQKATISYVDETTGETITVDEVTGGSDSPIGYTTADRIKALEEQGYELVTDGYPTDSVYDKDGNVDQNFIVTLRQKQVPVDPTDPTNPKDGSTLELTRTVTRTIEYKYIDENGQEASATVTQTATFTRTATVNMVTGEVTYGDWTSEDAELDAVDSPVIDGYTPNLANIPALTVDADSVDSTVIVVYTQNTPETPEKPETQTATISYVDEATGQVITVDKVSGDSDSPIGYTTADRIKALEEQGYELVTDGYPKESVYDKDGNVDQNFTVTLRQKVVPITPENPTNPKDGSTLELTRTVTRTIEYKYIDENGQEASATVTQTATFIRTATVNMVTGEVTYGDWTSADAELDAVDSPVIDSYTPNLANVPALTVNADSVDSSVIVVYTQNTQSNPNVDPKPVPTPDQAKPTTPANHVPTEQVKNVEESTEKPSLSKAKVLPNTGQEGSSSIFAIGVALAGLGLALLKKKKKEDDI
ncbi:LPXTG cell wall anchor domain-containing protein [Streptococcus suis]|nr:LPXTG cell wall anchor domain-containing protein [Streptococcus suis]